MRSVFGWDLPPGVTNRMIDDHFGGECCEDCWVDDAIDTTTPDHCKNDDCHCHATDDGDAEFDRQRDDALTED